MGIIDPHAKEAALANTKPEKFNTNTVVFILYLFYKCNLITRHHLRTMFKIIKEEAPGDIMKFLVEEERKAT